MARLTQVAFTNWVGAFENAIDTKEQLDNLTQLAANRTLDQVATNYGKLSEAITIVIRVADRESWLGKLLDVAVEESPEDEALLALKAEYKVALLVEPESPFEAIRIFGEAMLDREPFRKKLESLLGTKDSPVLLVHGPRYSGKSWSWRLISFAAEAKGVRAVKVDFEDIDSAIDGPTFGRLIAEAAELGDPPTINEEQKSQWVRQYCTWFGKQVKEGERLWVVIDHLDKVLLGQEATDFLHGFGRNIPSKMQGVRLILLSYDNPISLVSGIGAIQSDKVEPLPLNKMEEWLTRFFGAVLIAERGATTDAEIEALSPDVVDATRAVLSKVDGDSASRYVEMGDALREQLFLQSL